MSEELITLPASGALPGIPGEHAAGQYYVDMQARTIRPATSPLQGDVQQEIARLEEEVHTLTVEAQQQ